ncbi:hypothetical protein DPMN_090002 [Dreissena polymorpha]|uniref:Uncharacterized protein n=1 Tax=Dreissena polymorpha TaxID=45954 RepID=A0A9D4KXD5_DREPO|nr:hypothetical protein DPMN_090002 [Dreissena polymorpha]
MVNGSDLHTNVQNTTIYLSCACEQLINPHLPVKVILKGYTQQFKTTKKREREREIKREERDRERERGERERE